MSKRVLGRHVRNFSFERAALDAAREVGGLGNAEVGELDLATVAQQHVRGGDVAVDDAGGDTVLVCGVRKVECGAEGVCEVRREPWVKRFASAAQVTERCAKVGPFDQLEGEIVGAVGDAEVEDAGDVAVVEERRHAGLAEKHFDEVRLAAKVGRMRLRQTRCSKPPGPRRIARNVSAMPPTPRRSTSS